MRICGRAPAMAERLSSSRIPLLEQRLYCHTGNQTLLFISKFLLKFYLNKAAVLFILFY